MRGVGCFDSIAEMSNATCGFRLLAGCGLFPSAQESMDIKKVSVPLRGVGCFNPDRLQSVAKSSFRPLAGCGLFHQHRVRSPLRRVSVPLRGVGCFRDGADRPQMVCVSVPLRGMGCFDMQMRHWEEIGSFRPLAGCGLFPAAIVPLFTESVVSVPLRGVGCFGKAAHSFWCNRKKNCQLCYFIVSYWQMFINSKLRNCKVPCEAHKTAT